MASLEVSEVVLFEWNLVDNQYQQKSEVLYSFTSNKSYAYLLNAFRVLENLQYWFWWNHHNIYGSKW